MTRRIESISLYIFNHKKQGLLLEWGFVVIWFSMIITAFFLSTDAENYLKSALDRYPEGIAGLVFWVLFYMGAYIHFRFDERFTSLNSKKDVFLLVAINVIYHVLRWPIFFGIAASGNLLLITINFFFDLMLMVIAIVVIVIWLCVCAEGRMRQESATVNC